MIPLVKTFLPPSEILMPKLHNILYSGYIAQGDEVEKFERKFEDYIGSGYSLSLNSGTAALHISLILCGVCIDDEVISTALTAEPTNVAIKMVGAKIRYADVDYETGCISPDSILANINTKTKAIVVVDYAGIPVNVPAIKKISEEYGIPVIHDAAHSIGSSFANLKCGNYFDYTIFSFQAIKHITTIDGGILHLKIHDQYKKAKLIRWFGIDKAKSRLDNNITLQGYKYHMNNVNATIGITQLDYINYVVKRHIDNGIYFDEMLAGIPGIELLKYYSNSKPSYWLYTLKVRERDEFAKMMVSNGIMVSELHKRNDKHKYLNDFHTKLPILDKFYNEMIHIPCGWWVTDDDREFIFAQIKKGW